MKSSILIVTGAAECVHDDIMAAPINNKLAWMAIGLDAVDKYLYPIDYVATFHPDEIPAIKERRAKIGGNTDYKVISHEDKNNPDIVIKDWWKPTGSSALLGIQAAIEVLGYQRIILCGCPLIGKSVKGNDYEVFRRGWENNIDKIKDFVRSMSGWTRDFLGAPTEAWLNS